MTPEDWRDVVQNAIDETGHEDEVIVQLEVTTTGWRVVINSPQQTQAAPSVPSS